MSDFIGNNLLVVDGLNLSFRWKHDRYSVSKDEYNELTYEDALEFLREDRAADYFMEELKDTILSIAASYKARKVVLLADFGSSTWRKGIYPEYKQNREEQRQADRPVDRAIFRVFFEHYSDAIKEIQEEGDIEVIYSTGIEADDYAALICKTVNIYDHIWLVTSDKDWDLLISDKVSRFNWMTKSTWKNVRKDGPRPREITLNNWNEHYNYPVDMHLSIKALQGDDGDNLPGIDGVGPVYAKRLLDKVGGSIHKLVESIPVKGTANYIRNLNAGKDIISRNIKLMDITSSIDQVFTQEEKERVLLACLS